MDTKLRNISTNTVTKTIAFLLVVIFITAIVLQLQYVIFTNRKMESLFIKEYKNSQYFQGDIGQAIYETISLMNDPSNMNQERAYYYFISDGSEVYSNGTTLDKSFFESHGEVFYAFENGEWTTGENTNLEDFQYFYPGNSQYTIYIAFPQEYMAAKEREWQVEREKILPIGIRVAAFFVVALLLIIYLFIVTGRKPQDKGLHFSKIDNIYSDILMGALIAIGIIWLIVMDYFQSRIYISGKTTMDQLYYMILIGMVTVGTTALCGWILLSMARKIKGSRLMKHSFLYKTIDFIKSIFDGRRFERYPLTKSLFYRQIIFIITSAVLVFFTFVFLTIPPLILIPPIIEMVVIYWYITGNNKTFEDINKGFNESLEEKMKSERMKVALVTNVSHDLKTPLTSIISYIDLLSKEDLSETVRDYVNILSEKSNRLKQIVADLFDLAKSTSGDMHLDLETLDIKRLIEQTLGDMEDEIEKSGLEIRTRFPETSVSIVSDGDKLYRVFQNIIDNALKYSLKGTRIYVELQEEMGQAIATIKNTAAYEMDFTPEEILQRFNRGDKSRSTEGSGLGLSIAESFTNVCGGNLRVEIEGDMFKVIIHFPLAK